jgi:hypothetical protein
MGRKSNQKRQRRSSLVERYPPSEPCSCEVCLAYCRRPGWWTVAEAARAVDAGLAGRMMLEMAPELTFGVLAPAFRGAEGNFGLQEFASGGCGFLHDDRCQLHGTGLMPLECRFCHHVRRGQGEACHRDLEKDWNTPEGQALVERWMSVTGFKGAEYFRTLVRQHRPPVHHEHVALVEKYRQREAPAPSASVPIPASPASPAPARPEPSTSNRALCPSRCSRERSA